MAAFEIGYVMALTQKQIKQFRTIGHKLRPVVTVNGLGEGVVAELRRALADHELIKIKVNAEDREEKRALIEAACTETGAELVQQIGNTALIFLAAPKPNPKLSNLQRHKELFD